MDSSKKIYTVLVVDDKPMVKDLLADILDHYGYKSLSAANGIEALKIIDSDKPDMVITDINMAGMDGIELLRAIRTRYNSLPVVVMTGGSFSIPSEWMADGFLAKPFNIEELNELLQGLLCTQKTQA